MRKVFRKVRKDFQQSIFDIQYSCVSNSPPSLKGGVAVGRGGSVDSHQCLLIASFPEVISPHKSQLRNNLSELSAGTIFSLCVFFAKLFVPNIQDEIFLAKNAKKNPQRAQRNSNWQIICTISIFFVIFAKRMDWV